MKIDKLIGLAGILAMWVAFPAYLIITNSEERMLTVFMTIPMGLVGIYIVVLLPPLLFSGQTTFENEYSNLKKLLTQ